MALPPSPARAGGDTDLAEYLAQLDKIGGWLTEVDAQLFELVDRAQQAQGIDGHLLEIGAYHGKSSILLGYLRHGADKLVICDLFGREPDAEGNIAESAKLYAGLERRTFEENWARFHRDAPEIIEDSSTRLLDRGLGPEYRLIHVDGCHDYEIVRVDVATSQRLAKPSAVVVFDDYRTQGIPGVAAAVWEAIANGGLRPLLFSDWKLYATWDDDEALQARLFDLVTSTGLAVEPARVFDYDALCVSRRATAAARLLPYVPPALVPRLRRGLDRVRALRSR